MLLLETKDIALMIQHKMLEAAREGVEGAMPPASIRSGTLRQTVTWRSISDVSAGERPRRTSTTLSHSQLTKAVFGLLHPLHVSRATDKQQPSKDLLDECAGLRKRERWSRNCQMLWIGRAS